MKRKFLFAAALAAAVAALTPSAAFAGEVTGNGAAQGDQREFDRACTRVSNDSDPADGGSGVVQRRRGAELGPQQGSAGTFVSAPRGASDVVLNFGDGDFAWGCNGISTARSSRL